VISPSQSISGVSAVYPLVAFYDIHGRKIEVLFFYFVPDTTRDCEKRQCYDCHDAEGDNLLSIIEDRAAKCLNWLMIGVSRNHLGLVRLILKGLTHIGLYKPVKFPIK
jgi:hypothetical protein